MTVQRLAAQRLDMMMRLGFANEFRQRQSQRLSHNQPVGDIEIGAHFLRENLHVAHQRLALRQRPAHQGN